MDRITGPPLPCNFKSDKRVQFSDMMMNTEEIIGSKNDKNRNTHSFKMAIYDVGRKLRLGQKSPSILIPHIETRSIAKLSDHPK